MVPEIVIFNGSRRHLIRSSARRCCEQRMAHPLLNRPAMTESQMKRLPNGLPVTDNEAEDALLEKVADSTGEEERAGALWHLVAFYRYHLRRNDVSIGLLKLMIEESASAERSAIYYLALGQIAEAEKNWDLAVLHYNKGLGLSPANQQTSYALNNNLGFCLNARRDYAEAEDCCRRAIQIDPERHNAFKNLGLSLYGQGKLLGAAWAWVDATKLNPADSSSLNMLKALIRDHPDLLRQSDWIFSELWKHEKTRETFDA